MTICMYPALIMVAARAKEVGLSSVAGVGSFATKRCEVSRKMRDASYE